MLGMYIAMGKISFRVMQYIITKEFLLLNYI